MKILVPTLGESVAEATVAKWLKKKGDNVSKDEVLVELETDKATLEVYAQSNGVLSEIYINAGQDVEIGAELAEFLEKEGIDAAEVSKLTQPESNNENNKSKITNIDSKNDNVKNEDMTERQLISSSDINRSGIGNKITKNDIEEFITGENLSPSERREKPNKSANLLNNNIEKNTKISSKNSSRIPMTRIQRTMAERLKKAQNDAAMLTTFNEVDMSEVINIRKNNKENFEKKFGVKLGFMSFFCNAVVLALKEIKIINSEIDGHDIIYHDHIDIGIALGAPQGLLVPVIRSVDKKSFFEIEKEIFNFGEDAREGSITSDQMTGATFTITNGGVYGSMMSTPIINPPQSGILGLHQIKDRPVVENGEIIIKPMMYVALTYDHRAVSGKEAVSFLVKVKQFIEQPDRMLIGL
ncbi:MAG: 2-oxoglutarate dehydrogenase complex dihydrolipoyllysine-residue succinyltransferase [Alphaproteobacteria bacterium]